jgi:hypothetical protein
MFMTYAMDGNVDVCEKLRHVLFFYDVKACISSFRHHKLSISNTITPESQDAGE